MNDKSYVGMANCFFCGKPKEIVLHKQLKEVLPRETVYDREPCAECIGWMEKGIILIEVDGVPDKDILHPIRRSGWLVMSEEYINRVAPPESAKSIIKARWTFVPTDQWNFLKLPRGNIVQCPKCHRYVDPQTEEYCSRCETRVPQSE